MENGFFRAESLRRPHVSRKIALCLRDAFCGIFSKQNTYTFIKMHNGNIQAVRRYAAYDIFKIIIPRGVYHKLKAVAPYLRRKPAKHFAIIAVVSAYKCPRRGVDFVFHSEKASFINSILRLQ
jgi:hypothetical protein